MANEKNFLTVTEVTIQLKQLISENFFSVRVQGEVSNFKIASSGHFYFSLKDTKAQLNVVLFKSKIPSNFSIKNGDLVVLEGSIEVYEPNGSYQLIVRSIQKAGVGDLLAKIQALKEHYQALGYFNQERKKSLPAHPKKVGIITALTGAVIQDIIKVLNCRVDSYHLLIAPVKVQGAQAAAEISAAIDMLNEEKLVDVIIVARGGGSFEDLLAFNDPAMIEAAFRSSIPIISAVGHETDFTLLDFVSDKRAATPSMAAEIVMPKTTDIIQAIFAMSKRIQDSYASFLFRLKKNLSSQTKVFISKKSLEALNKANLMLSNAEESLLRLTNDNFKQKKERLLMLYRLMKEKNPMQEQQRKKQELEKLQVAIKHRFSNFFLQLKNQQEKIAPSVYSSTLYSTVLRKKALLKSASSRLEALNPKAILKKGYCIPFMENSNQIMPSISHVKQNTPFDLLFHDGKIKVQPQKEVLNESTKFI
jgi:exodeoxyribonuclease VII large subunit